MAVLHSNVLFKCIFLLGIICVGYCKQSGGLPSMRRLFDDLIAKSNYNKMVVPTGSDGNALTVTFNLDIKRLIALNKETQVLSLDAAISMMWYDPQLMWDPREYGGIEMIRLPSHMVWQPDIILYNSADQFNSIPSGDINMVITNDGLVVYSPLLKTNSFCKVPNKQPSIGEIVTCSLKFGSWSYDGLTLDVIPAGLTSNDDAEAEYDVELPLFEKEFNREWELISFTVKRNVVIYPCCPEPYIDLTYRLTCRFKGD